MYADYGITTVQVLGSRWMMFRTGSSCATNHGQAPAVPWTCARADRRSESAKPENGTGSARLGQQVRRLKVDIIKMHITGSPMDMTPAVYGALIDEAHKRGIRAAAHMLY
jgi:hypothetical protein